jgi:endonuclease/exonuclease/phosphatase (EEP) superfamily protein YafD
VDFPHVQCFILTVLLTTALVIINGFDQWGYIAVYILALATIIYQVSIIFPYTKLAKKQAKDLDKSDYANRISLLEANVLMDNNEYHKLNNLILKYRPDIFITLESDAMWQASMDELSEFYPYSVKVPLDNTYGMHLYSKLKLSNEKVSYLIEKDVPSIEADVELQNGMNIRLYVVHPKPPSPTQNDYSTERDAELVLVGKKTRTCNLPVIVAGDLNDVAWSHTTRLFQRISRLLDPRLGRGFFNTFHAKYSFIRWPLDHIFHSKDFLVADITRLPEIGSDHYPMYVELYLEPTTAKAVNNQPDQKTASDAAESRDKIESANS